jgi:hypothetical protein
MTIDELIAITRAGPAVIMVAKDDMLKLLRQIAEMQAPQPRRALQQVTVDDLEWQRALHRWGDMEKADRKENGK